MLTANPNNYRYLGLVGQGQFAQVYCAAHRCTGKIVAFKQTRHARVSTSQESKILPKLNHPNVAGYYAAERTEEGCCFALEYCESGTLRNYLNAFSPLSFSQAKSFLIDLLSGLDYIHAREIIHGDLKPENILLTCAQSGLIAKLSDFGNACSSNDTHQSQIEIGSPTYAAPERFDGYVSYATDLYSVGVMLYEMLLGDRPFSGSPHQLQRAHQEQPVPLPNGLTAPAIQLIKTALHKVPSRRFKSANAMLSAVQQLSNLYQSDTAQFSQYTISSITAVHPSVDRALTSAEFSFPVESIISLFNGYGLKTDNSLYLLDGQQRSRLAPLSKSTQIAISPDCQWLITFDKNSLNHSSVSQIGKFYKVRDSKVERGCSRSLFLKNIENRQTTTLKIIALDNRYLLRLDIDKAHSTTFLSCFTRRGQFVGEYKLNFVLSQAAIAHSPYQLIACLKDTPEPHARVALISLKPFQVRYLPCASFPCCACATAWGYVVVCQRNIYFFDRDRNLIGQVEHALEINAVAPLSDHQLLLSTPQAAPYLQLLDLSQLALDIIF